MIQISKNILAINCKELAISFSIRNNLKTFAFNQKLKLNELDQQLIKGILIIQVKNLG
jgi:hypothetical protein